MGGWAAVKKIRRKGMDRLKGDQRIPDDPDTPEDEGVRWVESVHAPDAHTVEISFGEELPESTAHVALG